MLAFQKVQGLERTGGVGPALWSALDTPKLPHLRYPGQGDHLEVDKTLQVLLVAHAGKVVWISPVSTGGPGKYTPEGTYRVLRKVAGLRSLAARHALGSDVLHGRLRRAREPVGARRTRRATAACACRCGSDRCCTRACPIGEPVDVYES